jgi:hypothetical protein
MDHLELSEKYLVFCRLPDGGAQGGVFLKEVAGLLGLGEQELDTRGFFVDLVTVDAGRFTAFEVGDSVVAAGAVLPCFGVLDVVEGLGGKNVDVGGEVRSAFEAPAGFFGLVKQAFVGLDVRFEDALEVGIGSIFGGAARIAFAHSHEVLVFGIGGLWIFQPCWHPASHCLASRHDQREQQHQQSILPVGHVPHSFSSDRRIQAH